MYTHRPLLGTCSSVCWHVRSASQEYTSAASSLHAVVCICWVLSYGIYFVCFVCLVCSIRDGATPPPDVVMFNSNSDVPSANLDEKAMKRHRAQMKRLLQFGADRTSKTTVEMCVTLSAVSAGMVCAGSGDLDVMRILRVLRAKIDDVSYGSHMGIAMAVGK